jgi:hypothetical protein
MSMHLEMRPPKHPKVAPLRCVVEARPSKQGTRAIVNRTPLVTYSVLAFDVYPMLQANMRERETLFQYSPIVLQMQGHYIGGFLLIGSAIPCVLNFGPAFYGPA